MSAPIDVRELLDAAASGEVGNQCCMSHALVPMSRMWLCTECGNKRCPKATNCANDCTGSNEPGQPGSAY